MVYLQRVDMYRDETAALWWLYALN